jgi:hypothetical protein
MPGESEAAIRWIVEDRAAPPALAMWRAGQRDDSCSPEPEHGVSCLNKRRLSRA